MRHYVPGDVSDDEVCFHDDRRPPLPKRFPGEACMRAKVWAPSDRETVTAEFEGRIPRGLAKLLVAAMVDQSRVTPEMDELLGGLAVDVVLGRRPSLASGRTCTCYDDGVMCVLGDGCPEHDHRVRR